MPAFTDYKIGEVDKDIQLESKDENLDAITMLTTQSKRSIDIISRDLDPLIYDQTEFLEPLKKLALRGRRVQIRILAFEIQSVVRNGHRLIELAAKLSSFIDIREPGTEFNDYNSGMFIADNTAYLLKKHADRYEARANFNDKRQARILLQDFEEMWETAKPSPYTRRMTI